MKVVLASHNKKKMVEMRTILSAMGVEVLSQAEVGVDLEPEETGTTFEENARIKARAVMEADSMSVAVLCSTASPPVSCSCWPSGCSSSCCQMEAAVTSFGASGEGSLLQDSHPVSSSAHPSASAQYRPCFIRFSLFHYLQRQLVPAKIIKYSVRHQHVAKLRQVGACGEQLGGTDRLAVMLHHRQHRGLDVDEGKPLLPAHPP